MYIQHNNSGTFAVLFLCFKDLENPHNLQQKCTVYTVCFFFLYNFICSRCTKKYAFIPSYVVSSFNQIWNVSNFSEIPPY